MKALSFTTNSSSSTMVRQTVIFLSLLIILDFMIAGILDRGYRHIHTGPGRYNHIKSNRYDCLIMGSSTSTAYYSDIISRETGFSTLNVGIDGSALIYSRCLLDLVIHHHVKPKIVILNIDLFELSPQAWSGNYYSMIEKLAPLYGETPFITKALEKDLYTEKMKYWMQTYKFNDLMLSIPVKLMKDQEDYRRKKAPADILKLPLDEQTMKDRFPLETDIDDRKKILYESFVKVCLENAIKIIFIESPIYYPDHKLTARDQKYEAAIHIIALQYKIPFIILNQETDTRYTDPFLFKDVLHLNHMGARLFSRSVSQEINNLKKGYLSSRATE